jgi:hypothetical protein
VRVSKREKEYSMVEPISLSVAALIVVLVVVAWAAVAMWNAHVTERDAKRRARREVVRNWQYVEPPHVSVWDDCRAQCEGASVTREQ